MIFGIVNCLLVGVVNESFEVGKWTDYRLRTLDR